MNVVDKSRGGSTEGQKGRKYKLHCTPDTHCLHLHKEGGLFSCWGILTEVYLCNILLYTDRTGPFRRPQDACHCLNFLRIGVYYIVSVLAQPHATPCKPLLAVESVQSFVIGHSQQPTPSFISPMLRKYDELLESVMKYITLFLVRLQRQQWALCSLS